MKKVKGAMEVKGAKWKEAKTALIPMSTEKPAKLVKGATKKGVKKVKEVTKVGGGRQRGRRQRRP